MTVASWYALLISWLAIIALFSYTAAEGPTVVLVTGSSTGIGKATALKFAQHSSDSADGTEYKVWASMRNTDAAAQWSEYSSLPENLKLMEMDVTDDESVQRAIHRIITEDGRIDVVVNNAGYGIAGCLEVVSIEEAKNLFDVNVWGVVRVLQAVLPHMRNLAASKKPMRGGLIINISSTSGIRGIPCMEYYTGSKFALEGITDSMRYSLSPFNISVTNINAGPVKTSFTDRFGHAERGGRGTRGLLLNSNHNDSSSDYLNMLTGGMIAGLNARISGSEGQTADDVAQVVVNVAELKRRSKRLTDVPFNIGSSEDSSKLLQEIRRQPSGWGGLYNDILRSMPPLSAARQKSDNASREEL